MPIITVEGRISGKKVRAPIRDVGRGKNQKQEGWRPLKRHRYRTFVEVLVMARDLGDLGLSRYGAGDPVDGITGSAALEGSYQDHELVVEVDLAAA